VSAPPPIGCSRSFRGEIKGAYDLASVEDVPVGLVRATADRQARERASDVAAEAGHEDHAGRCDRPHHHVGWIGWQTARW
jgi:hypothetical protein